METFYRHYQRLLFALCPSLSSSFGFGFVSFMGFRVCLLGFLVLFCIGFGGLDFCLFLFVLGFFWGGGLFLRLRLTLNLRWPRTPCNPPASAFQVLELQV